MRTWSLPRFKDLSLGAVRGIASETKEIAPFAFGIKNRLPVIGMADRSIPGLLNDTKRSQVVRNEIGEKCEVLTVPVRDGRFPRTLVLVVKNRPLVTVSEEGSFALDDRFLLVALTLRTDPTAKIGPEKKPIQTDGEPNDASSPRFTSRQRFGDRDAHAVE